MHFPGTSVISRTFHRCNGSVLRRNARFFGVNSTLARVAASKVKPFEESAASQKFETLPDMDDLIAVPLVALCADLAFEIPPIRTSINIANQPFALSISGDISGVRPSGGETEQPFRLNLHADLADFQSRLTAVLQGN